MAYRLLGRAKSLESSDTYLRLANNVVRFESVMLLDIGFDNLDDTNWNLQFSSSTNPERDVLTL